MAAFAGNRFGKSTVLVVRALTDVLDARELPERLRQFKRFDRPSHGWLLCPTEDKIYDSLKPAIEKWCPAHCFKGGAWGKAFNGERMLLTFANGSTVSFKTYKQDPSTLGGADLDWVGYDEPPPMAHREEAMTRLAGEGLKWEAFAMTPLDTNVAYARREIWKKRESPDITVVRGSMHDNPTLSKKAVEHILSSYHSDLWRRAREFGDFVDVGGVIYEDFERAVIDLPAGLDVSDVVVGIDPGIRNTGLVFVAFDRNDVGTVFAEALLQDARTEGVAHAIWRTLDAWEVRRSAPLFVIDPSVPRSQTSEQTLQTALAVLGIGCVKAQNSVEAGIQQVRSRLADGRLFISRSCVGLRDEADEYAAEDRPDGEFKPVKANDHRLDALRYVCMTHPFYPAVEAQAPQRDLGRQLGSFMPDASALGLPREGAPMGAMS